MVTHSITVTVAADGTIRLPADAARPGETITVQIERPATVEPADQPETGEPVRLTRLTAKTSEQKEQLRRQIDEIVDRLAPMLKDMPDHGDFLYGDDGLPR